MLDKAKYLIVSEIAEVQAADESSIEAQVDKALAIARRPEVIFTSFGDMLRVPGSETDLLSVKALV